VTPPGWLDLAISMAYNIAMKIANIAELKNRISEFVSAVENGEEIEVHRRNVPVARIVPIAKAKVNATKLGCGAGTGRILGSLTEPFMPDGDWEK
jgi:prevent-host-death family protein